MIKTIIIQIILFFSSYLIPKKKNLIVLGSGDKSEFKGNPKFLYLYINQNNTDFDAIWSAGEKKLFDELKNKGLPVIYRNSLKGFFTILRAKFLVVEKSAKDVYYTHSIFGRFNFIQTWHGTTLKKIGIHALEDNIGSPSKSAIAKEKTRKVMQKFGMLSMMKYKLFLSTTKNQNKILKEAFLNKNIKAIGYPRNDLFFNKDLTYKSYKKEFGLDDFSKIILYAPTFRDEKEKHTPLSDNILAKMNSYFIEENILFLVKKHPLEKNLDIPQNLSNIKDVSSLISDIHDILPDVDLLISDYSSVFNDFILTNRPVIYYNYDIVEYEKTCRGFYYNYNEILSGAFAENEEKLFSLIKNIDIWTKEVEYQERFKKQKQYFHDFIDGNSSKRLLEELKNI